MKKPKDHFYAFLLMSYNTSSGRRMTVELDIRKFETFQIIEKKISELVNEITNRENENEKIH